MVPKSPGWQDFLLLVILSAILGASFLLTEISIRSFSPLVVVAARLWIAALVLLGWLLFTGARLPGRGRHWYAIAASALFGNALPFSLITWGQVRVTPGITAIFMAVMPLATILLAHVYTRDERLNPAKVIGVLLGLVGVVVLVGPAHLNGIGHEWLHQLAIACAALCYAVNAIVTKHLVGIPKIPLLSALLLIASLLMLPAMLLMPAQPSHPSLAGSVAVLISALGPTALAALMIVIIVERQGASFLSQINFLVPLFGVIFAWIFLHELLPPSAWMALVLILLGVATTRFGASQGRAVQASGKSPQ